MEDIKKENEINQEVDERKFFTALNDSSLAVLWTIYNMVVNSPLMIVMKKMSEYSSFNEFLVAAGTSDASSFYPELNSNSSKDEKPS